MSDLTNDDEPCGPRCTDEPCVASREPNCDGQEDPISFEPIPAGQGWCLNGNCFDLDTLSRINDRRDPFSRYYFTFANADVISAVNQLQRRANANADHRLQRLHRVMNAALIDAAGGGNVDIVRLLLEARTDLGNDLDTTNALIDAAGGGHTEIVQLLLEADPGSVYAVDSSNEPALLHAARNGHTEIVRLLLEADARPDEPPQFPHNNTDLMYAAGGGHTEIVGLLIEAGADVDGGNDEGEMPLIIAARGGHTEIVRLLLEADAYVEHLDDEGNSALMYAAGGGHTEIVGLLIEAGADVNATNAMNEDETVLTRAARNGHVEILQLLIRAGADRFKPYEIMRLLREAGATMNARNDDGDMAFMRAAEEGQTDEVRHLIDEGADVNAMVDGYTALMRAAGEGHTDTVRLLIGARADVNARNDEGETALTLAEDGGHVGVAQLLNQAGANQDVLPRVINAIRRRRENDDSQSGRRTRRRSR